MRQSRRDFITAPCGGAWCNFKSASRARSVPTPISFLQLDTLLNDERAEREEAYFNVGYEYGANAVRHRVLSEMARRVWPKRLDVVAAHFRDEVMQAGLSSAETLLVLVESLWVLAVRESAQR